MLDYLVSAVLAVQNPDVNVTESLNNIRICEVKVPPTKLPLLRLGTSIVDYDNNIVDADMYYVKVAEEKDYLYFIRNNQTVARFKIDAYTGSLWEFQVPYAEVTYLADKKVVLKTREGNFEFTSYSTKAF